MNNKQRSRIFTISEDILLSVNDNVFNSIFKNIRVLRARYNYLKARVEYLAFSSDWEIVAEGAVPSHYEVNIYYDLIGTPTIIWNKLDE